MSPILGLQGRDFIREKIRIRDKRTCQRCGKKWKKGQRRFDVHHTKSEEEGSLTYKIDFKHAITYCHKCHLTLHSVRRKMRNAFRFKASKELHLTRLKLVKKYLKQGLNQRQIAKKIGITFQGINSHYIKKYRLLKTK